jgi:hypothetical protein
MTAHDDHPHGQEHATDHAAHAADTSLALTAAVATLHCLTGCAIGEVLGMVIGTAIGLSNTLTVVLAIVLAFFFGYSLTMLPLLRSGLALAVVLPLAFASDTFSIAVMEVVDNLAMVTIPGAMDAGLGDLLFWGALGFALAIAFFAAWPVNRYLIARGRGHAVVHEFHHGGPGAHEGASPEPPRLNARRLASIGVVAIAFTVAVGVAGAQIAEHSGADDMEQGMEHAAPDAESDGAEHGAMGHEGSGGGQTSAPAAAASGLSLSDGGYRLEVSRTRLERGRPQDVSLTISDSHGEPVTRMEEHGGVQLHLIVVRRDLTGFQHVHPRLVANQTWKSTLTLPEAGVYRALADFTVDGKQTVLGQDLFVPGAFAPQALAAPETDTDVDGYRVVAHAHARALDEGELSFTVTRNGRRVAVEPYLGADGHLVALRHGDLAYLHVHPLAATEPGHIKFMATFPSPGPYRLFLQFNDDGRIHTAPFTLEVT